MRRQDGCFYRTGNAREGLYLFGAGHISQYTAALAKTLGFYVTVIDPRPEYNSIERFPEADNLVKSRMSKPSRN